MSKKFLKTLASAALAALACGCAKKLPPGTVRRQFRSPSKSLALQ